jgi:hypothetical protein
VNVAWFGWLKRRRLDDDDFQDEIRAHLDMATADRVADGADRRSARLDSLKQFGNVTLTTEAARSAWTPRWIEAPRDWLNDARYAIRVLAKSPAFTLTVVTVLGLGIGLNATVFTLLKSLALSPLSGVDGSGRLGVVLNETRAGRREGLSYPDYKYLRDHDRAFTGLIGSALISVALGRVIAPNSSAPSSSPATTFSSWAFARSWAVRFAPRMRSPRVNRRSSC